MWHVLTLFIIDLVNPHCQSIQTGRRYGYTPFSEHHHRSCCKVPQAQFPPHIHLQEGPSEAWHWYPRLSLGLTKLLAKWKSSKTISLPLPSGIKVFALLQNLHLSEKFCRTSSWGASCQRFGLPGQTILHGPRETHHEISFGQENENLNQQEILCFHFPDWEHEEREKVVAEKRTKFSQDNFSRLHFCLKNHGQKSLNQLYLQDSYCLLRHLLRGFRNAKSWY